MKDTDANLVNEFIRIWDSKEATLQEVIDQNETKQETAARVIQEYGYYRLKTQSSEISLSDLVEAWLSENFLI